MKHRRFLPLWLILPLLLAASYLINDRTESLPAATIAGNGNLKAVVLTDTANRPQPMKEQKFTYTITDENGQPVSGAIVDVSLTMPGMFCGVIPARLTEMAPGTYVAVGIPVMKGNWTAVASIRAGSDHLRVEHPFPVG